MSGKEKKRVLLVISGLKMGGAERVLSVLANGLVNIGYDVALLTIVDHESLDSYYLDQRIKRISLSALKSNKIWINIFRRMKLIRKVSCKYDVVISFMRKVNVLMLLALWYKKIPVIVSERTACIRPTSFKGYVWYLLVQWLYPKAFKVVVQTNSIASNLKEKNDLIDVEVIGNPISQELLDRWEVKECYELGEEKTIVAVGRLVEEKGYDLLVEACRPIVLGSQWKLSIYGDGPLRKHIEEKIEREYLTDKVIIHGSTEQPWSAILAGDIYVLSSRQEGMPNAMMEAMALGVPVVAADCESGPRELSQDGTLAMLVQSEDVDSLRRGLEKMISGRKIREHYGRAGIAVREIYSVGRVCSEWDKIIKQCT